MVRPGSTRDGAPAPPPSCQSIPPASHAPSPSAAGRLAGAGQGGPGDARGRSAPAPRQAAGTQPAVSAAALTCGNSRDGSPLLRDVTFRAPPGTTLAVAGPNGCGKTLLLRALAGMVPLRGGRLAFFGKEARDACGTEPPYPPRLYVPRHDPSPPPFLTVAEAVALGRAVSPRRAPSAARPSARVGDAGPPGPPSPAGCTAPASPPSPGNPPSGGRDASLGRDPAAGMSTGNPASGGREASLESGLASGMSPGRPGDGPLVPAGALARAREALETLGAGELADLPAWELTEGAVHVARLARALFHAPPLLLLDEPVAGLPPEDRARVLAGLKLHAAERGALVIASLHDPLEIIAWADAALLLRGGAQEAFGPPAEVLGTPAREALYGPAGGARLFARGLGARNRPGAWPGTGIGCGAGTEGNRAKVKVGSGFGAEINDGSVFGARTKDAAGAGIEDGTGLDGAGFGAGITGGAMSGAGIEDGTGFRDVISDAAGLGTGIKGGTVSGTGIEAGAMSGAGIEDKAWTGTATAAGPAHVLDEPDGPRPAWRLTLRPALCPVALSPAAFERSGAASLPRGGGELVPRAWPARNLPPPARPRGSRACPAGPAAPHGPQAPPDYVPAFQHPEGGPAGSGSCSPAPGPAPSRAPGPSPARAAGPGPARFGWLLTPPALGCPALAGAHAAVARARADGRGRDA
jgi:ABC-type cobalamin/Fe3+-siderophores transport system ATPase subunit